LAALGLRDRDAIITKEGLIFRVFGYSHPANAYICDVEYASAEIFKSDNPKAFRNRGQRVFYKFYEDEGWKFIKSNFPQYMLIHEMLQKQVVGVENHNIAETRKSDIELGKLIEEEPKDELHAAMQSVLELVAKHSDLLVNDFGVFGSLLHRFYHPKLSDIDLIIYGRDNALRLRETLWELYNVRDSPVRNEFESIESIKGKRWRFQNYSPEEFVQHQQRKTIYALFSDEKSGRVIKTEFEPVKAWKEIRNEYNSDTRILQKGWVKMFATIIGDQGAPFIPSIYRIQPMTVLHGPRGAEETTRIVSYVEEFRMQAWKDEQVYIEGNLEEVKTPKSSFHQMALTYCPRYYEQVLKVVS